MAGEFRIRLTPTAKCLGRRHTWRSAYPSDWLALCELIQNTLAQFGSGLARPATSADRRCQRRAIVMTWADVLMPWPVARHGIIFHPASDAAGRPGTEVTLRFGHDRPFTGHRSGGIRSISLPSAMPMALGPVEQTVRHQCGDLAIADGKQDASLAGAAQLSGPTHALGHGGGRHGWQFLFHVADSRPVRRVDGQA